MHPNEPCRPSSGSATTNDHESSRSCQKPVLVTLPRNLVDDGTTSHHRKSPSTKDWQLRTRLGMRREINAYKSKKPKAAAAPAKGRGKAAKVEEESEEEDDEEDDDDDDDDE